MEVVRIIVNTLVGLALVPFLQWLKAKTGLKGIAMRWVTYVCIFLVTVAIGLALKAFGYDFSPEGFATGAGVLGIANQLAYTIYKTVIANLEK
ncbi:MAG: hypothetical protein NZ651_07135 [Candidatus Bipolaricaulota bacterium]|nr:hypothetical protein [Candidatus Bipolaricaulota bacterium]MDW8127527.1 hypothetical protein [Candidatus Bipolaricaulota bacterium]